MPTGMPTTVDLLAFSETPKVSVCSWFVREVKVCVVCVCCVCCVYPEHPRT